MKNFATDLAGGTLIMGDLIATVRDPFRFTDVPEMNRRSTEPGCFEKINEAKQQATPFVL